MKKTKRFSHILILAIILLLLLIATSSIVIAQQGGGDSRSGFETEEERAPVTVPGGPGFVSVHPIDFRPIAANMEWAYLDRYQVHSMELYNPSFTVPGVYLAPVSLPHGATVTKVVLYYYDASDFSTIDAFLVRRPLSGGVFSDMAVLVSSMQCGACNVSDITISNALVNLQDYAYYLEVELATSEGSAKTLVGMRVDYRYPNYLPDIKK